MMNCEQYRQALLAAPRAASADVAAREHGASCAACSAYTAQVLEFEGRLEKALALDPASLASARSPRLPARDETAIRPPLLARRAPRRSWLALAASVVMAVGVAGVLWLAAPRGSLAADVVTHMDHEPNSWSSAGPSVPAQQLDEVLAHAGVKLRADAGNVTYLKNCSFRGHRVPHLVVQYRGAPVTVMILPDEPIAAAMKFDEQGYRGVIQPAPRGSIAIVTRGNLDVKPIAEQVFAAVEWLR
jgi:Protein of unknown function (DUF3379)